jgi:hypothetical protein
MSAAKPTWRDVKKVLQQQEKDQLIGLIQDLHKLSTTNADFMQPRPLQEADQASDKPSTAVEA